MDAMRPDERVAVVSRHLAALRGRSDPAGYLASLAPDFFVVVGTQALRRRDVTPALLAAAWEQAPETARFEEPRDIDASGELLLATLPEASSGQEFRAAFGLAREDGQWCVAWAGLCEGDPLPAALARTAAHAELASLDALAPFGPFRSLLDVAFTRMARLPDEKLLFLPETRFSCHGTGLCCSQALTIPLEPHAALFLAETDWPALAPGVGAGPYVWDVSVDERDRVGFDHMLAYRDDGTCHLLRDDNRCAVHALLGRAVLTPCHVFPYHFAWSPDGVCVTVHHLCPSAAHQRGAPPRDQARDIRSRLAISGGVRADRFGLTYARDLSWEEFRAAEALLLDILAGPTPLAYKLWNALDWLKEYGSGAAPPAGEPELPPVDAAGWEVLERVAASFDHFFYRVEGLPAGGMPLAAMEPVLTRWFRSLVFGKTLTYAHGLVGGLNALALIYRIMSRQLGRWGDAGPPGAFWSNLFSLVTPARGAFQRHIATLYGGSADAVAAMTGSPLFGQNLLRPPSFRP